MARKLVLSGIAVAAIAALAVPAVAGAAPPLITDPPGTPVKQASLAKLTMLEDKVTNTALGTIECEVWNFENEITKNDSTGFEEVGIESEVSGCEAEGEPLTITNLTTSNVSSTSLGSGTLSIAFSVDIGPFECPFGGEVDFTYKDESDVVHIRQPLESPFAFCEGEFGKPEYDYTGTRETKDGTPMRASLKK